MIRFSIYLVLLFTIVHAEPIVHINTSTVDLSQFKMGYYIDTSENMPLEEIQKQTFIEDSNNLTLGTNADVTWIKIILSNESNTSKKLFVHNAVAYHAKIIHFYEVEHNTVIGDIAFGPRQHLNIDKMDGATALYKVNLKAGQKKTIYMKSHFLAYQLIEMGIYDEHFSKEVLVHRYMPIVMFFTLLATLALYYFILYISSGYKEYIYYALYLTSSAVFLAYSYGMISHYFHLYGDWGLKLNALAIITPVFLSLFIKYIFNTPKKYILQNNYINSLIIIFSLTYLYSFFDYYHAIEFTSLLFIYFMLVMLWVSVSLYKIDAPLIKYFLIAHVFYLIFTLIAILFYNNVIGYTYLTSHAIAIGTIIEALMLGFLVSYRIKLLESDNKKKEKSLLTDEMTTLYNKSYFDISLKKEILISRREQRNFTLMIIDIDYFKQYNDTYGHLEGDKTLIRVAKSLKNTLKRPTDMAFRIGGEEFAVLCSDMEEKMAISFADKLRVNIENLKIAHKTSTTYKYVTISIGLYTVPIKYINTPEQIYKYADDALYKAKSGGRNQVRAYQK